MVLGLQGLGRAFALWGLGSSGLGTLPWGFRVLGLQGLKVLGVGFRVLGFRASIWF